MMKATATQANGRTLVLLGLTHANLDQLRATGLKGSIPIDGKQIGIDVDICITAAESERAMYQALEQFIGADTKLHIDDKLKS